MKNSTTTKHAATLVHNTDGRLMYGPTPSGKILDIQSDALPAEVIPRIVECWDACAGIEDPAKALAMAKEALAHARDTLADEEYAEAAQWCDDALRALGG